jgi:hypothetical protein
VEILFEMRMDILKWHIYSFRRLGKGTGGRPILVKLTLLRKELEVLPTTRNLAVKNIRTEQNNKKKIKETFRDLFPYLKDARNEVNKAHTHSKKLTVNRKVYDFNFLK